MQAEWFLKYDVVFSFDLDNTTQTGCEGQLSDTVLLLFKYAQKNGIPCFITTNRNLRELIKSVQKNFKKSPPQLKNMKKYWTASSFINIITKLNEEKINTPVISTVYDPCETKQQALYYKRYDKVLEFIMKQLDSLIADIITREQFEDLLETMLYARQNGPEKNTQEIKDNTLGIDQNILSLLYEEYATASQFSTNRSLAYKYHQLLWIQKQTGCYYIIHLDDYEIVYKSMGVKDIDDVRLIPCKIDYQLYGKWLISEGTPESVIVCCVPFKEANSEIIIKTFYEGINLNTKKVIEELDEVENTCWPFACFFSYCLDPRERTTVAYLKSILKESIQPTMKQGLESYSGIETTQSLIERTSIELYITPQLKDTIKKIPRRLMHFFQENNLIELNPLEYKHDAMIPSL